MVNTWQNHQKNRQHGILRKINYNLQPGEGKIVHPMKEWGS